MPKGIHLRKYGIQEHNIVSTFAGMTKYSKFITRPEDVAYQLSYAIHIAKEGRKGPVWIDIPGDVQTAQMPEEYNLYIDPHSHNARENLYGVKAKLETAKRPIVLAGYGIRQSNTVNEFVNFIETYDLPLLAIDANDINTKKIQLYPNPTTGRLNILNAEINSLISIYSVSGMRVFTGKYEGSPINIEQIADGLYFVKINNTSFRLIIKH